ncbi:hypothetical protein MPU07_000061 [Staphylococcus pseudintermedius]|uniref:hypothetical protein n=1 Tax=Staphylococcus pseudintermedius TaxID=283734 RepID=UPI000D725A4A|nr:hypothetical protein [Staphylococcus pseudintermedius]EGQ1719775.1 hypothetical protein [Staphylococcus pseudintermedius]EGQ3289302.1 hypothetical protein [Staphylococcus pseudintermedius]EGQ3304078.1 hypothetical protein [Staphylococcus pseudintermedius]EGQ3367155.1 hypothetical protein [Staphylococcus pseudintermedius]EGQ3629416.1 hypothetical protein [Staphylococcus pseudintermedius]
MEDNKNLAKMYGFKAGYFFLAAFANIVSIIATKNYDLTMLGVCLYFSPIGIENYMKNIYNKPTKILRRIGYILPLSILFINMLIFILCSNIPTYKFIIGTNYYIGAIILVTVPLIFISILDVFLYGFNSEEIKAANDTKRHLRESRAQNQELILKQEEELKEEERQFKVKRSKRKG